MACLLVIITVTDCSEGTREIVSGEKERKKRNWKRKKETAKVMLSFTQTSWERQLFSRNLSPQKVAPVFGSEILIYRTLILFYFYGH